MDRNNHGPVNMIRIRNRRILSYLGGLLFLGGLIFLIFSQTHKNDPTVFPPDSPGWTINIFTATDGLYFIPIAELVDSGIALDGDDLTKLQLTYRGKMQPLWITTDEQGILFYGRGRTSDHVPESVYQLSVGASPNDHTVLPGDAKIVLPEHPLAESNVYIEKAVLEENLIYYPQVTDGDRWLWESIPMTKERSYELTTRDSAGGLKEIVVRVWGNTEATANPDHHIVMMVNGVLISEDYWDGIGWHDIEVDVPTGSVEWSDTYTITLESPGDTAAPIENLYVNWIAVEYPRSPLALDGALRFTAGESAIRLGGFRGTTTLIDITDAQQPVLVGQHNIQDDFFPFLGEAGHSYMVVDEAGWMYPEKITQSMGQPDLLSLIAGADYVAIGSEDLLPGLEPLLDLRRQQGLNSISIPSQAIYDQFNYGFSEPEAIHQFLKMIVKNWNPSPRYVLLLGDATYDNLGYLSPPPRNNLPTNFVQTKLGGQTVSDVIYAMVDEDYLPDLAIGRLPADSLDQVDVWVDKVLSLESKFENGFYTDRVFAVADGQEPSFAYDASYFLEVFEPQFPTEMYTAVIGDTNAPAVISEALDEGVRVFAYFGHGSLSMWGKDRLFSVEDVAGLENPVIPLLVQMTCLTGFFTHPKIPSLSEALLFVPQSGAAAIIAPTSLTLSFNQSSFSHPFAQALTDDNFVRLGDAFLYAQRNINQEGTESRDVLLTYLLFGDPALRIR